MKILQLVTRRQLRGAEVFAAQLSDLLVEAGHDVLLAGLYPPADPPLEPCRTATADIARRRPRGPISLPLALRLAGLLRRRQPDLIQANGSDTLKYSVLARRISGHRAPLVYRNISISSRWLRGPLHRAWNRRLFRAVDHVVAVSERSRSDLMATHEVAAEAVTRIPRAVTLDGLPAAAEARQALCDAAGCDPQRPIAVHIGSFTPEKDHAGLLDVLDRLRSTGGSAPQMVFFGDGPLRQQTIERAAARGVGDHAFFPGTDPRAARMLPGADLLVLFSTVEGMPGVLLEAGAAGVPVVATDVGGVPELVTDGETGLLVASGDAPACAAAIARLLAAPDLRQRLSQGLRQRVASDYALDQVVARYEALYRELRSGWEPG